MADAPNKEVMRYELDTSDVDPKLRAMQQKFDQTLAAMKQRADQNEFKAFRQTENARDDEAFRSWRQQVKGEEEAAEKAKLSIDKLTRSKRDMGDVVSLLGGKFQGLIGDVSGVVELFGALGKHAVPVTGVLLGVTALAEGYRALAAAAEEAAKQQERANAAAIKMRGESAVRRDEVARYALKFGIAGDASGMMADISSMASAGVPEDFGLQTAAAERVAAAGGAGFDRRAFLGGLAVSGGAADFASVDPTKRLGFIAEMMRAGSTPDAQAVLKRFKSDVAGKVVQEHTASDLPGRTPEEVAAGMLKQTRESGAFGDRYMALIEDLVLHPDKIERGEVDPPALMSEVFDVTPAKILGLRKAYARWSKSGPTRIVGGDPAEVERSVHEAKRILRESGQYPEPTPDLFDVYEPQSMQSEPQRGGGRSGSGPATLPVDNGPTVLHQDTYIGTAYFGGNLKYSDARYAPNDTAPASGFTHRR